MVRSIVVASGRTVGTYQEGNLGTAFEHVSHDAVVHPLRFLAERFQAENGTNALDHGRLPGTTSPDEDIELLVEVNAGPIEKAPLPAHGEKLGILFCSLSASAWIVSVDGRRNASLRFQSALEMPAESAGQRVALRARGVAADGGRAAGVDGDRSRPRSRHPRGRSGACLRAVLPPRGLASRNPGTGGTGLGLSIARNIAQSMGGDVTLRNREGGGLEARMRLPRLPDAVAERRAR